MDQIWVQINRHIDAFKDFGYLAEGIESTRFDRDKQHLVQEYIINPDAIISKYSLSSEKLNPSILINHNTYPVPDSNRKRKAFYRRYIHATFDGYSGLYNEFKVYEKPRHTFVAGCDIYESKFRYMFRHRDAAETLVFTKHIEIFHKDENYKILMSGFPAIDEISLFEERNFIDSIHLI